jgi:chromosome segregation ATPase
MTTLDLKAIEERLAAYDPVDTDDVMREVDSCHDDIRALLGMVRERDAEAQELHSRIHDLESTIDALGDAPALLVAAEAKLAEVSGQLALIQSVRAAEEEQLAEVTRERDAYKKAKSENDDRFMRERDEARSTVAANTETLRSIIASASYRLVWAVDGRGSPEQALRAVEALGEAYRTLVAQHAVVANERDARPDISPEMAATWHRWFTTASTPELEELQPVARRLEDALRAHATKAKAKVLDV